MMVSSSTVANRLLRLAADAGRHLTPMQLLKLVFLCHGWMLGLYGRRLIHDPIEAWKYGPVIPSLYHAVKQYGGTYITEPVEGRRENLKPDQERLIDEVFGVYGDWSGPELSHLTHKAGSPWCRAIEKGGRGRRISDTDIKNYYGRRAHQANSCAPDARL